MKQTAIEWLISQFLAANLETNGGKNMYVKFPKDALEQAKAMEKEQIMNAYSKGHIVALLNRLPHSEEYYNETFK